MFNNDDDNTLYGQAGDGGQVEQVVDLELEARCEEARSYLVKRGLWPPTPLVPDRRSAIKLITQPDRYGELPF